LPTRIVNLVACCPQNRAYLGAKIDVEALIGECDFRDWSGPSIPKICRRNVVKARRPKMAKLLAFVPLLTAIALTVAVDTRPANAAVACGPNGCFYRHPVRGYCGPNGCVYRHPYRGYYASTHRYYGRP
jgi:hypothetical protein